MSIRVTPGVLMNPSNRLQKSSPTTLACKRILNGPPKPKELLGDWLDPSAVKERDEEQPFADDLSSKAPVTDDQPIKKKSGGRTFFEDTARQSSRLIPYAIGAVVLIVCVSAATSFYLNSSRLTDARKTFADCQAVLKQNRFTEAERQCQMALDMAKQVQFFRTGARDELLGEIETVRNQKFCIKDWLEISSMTGVISRKTW
jgi:hypothetical protein